jgi:D-arginine dehydrogenase
MRFMLSSTTLVAGKVVAMSDFTAEIAIIGGGIAGLSLAAELATTHRVVVLESEHQPGIHATGRSAANWEPSYGPPLIRHLTQASGAFLRHPPEGFAPAPLLTPRGVLIPVASAEDHRVNALLEQGYHDSDRHAACAMVPLLRHARYERFLHDPVCSDVDVDLLLQGWLRQLRRYSGQLICRAEVRGGQRAGKHWLLDTAAGTVSAAVLVNAAGAWADVVAQRLGVAPVGLVPKRRSAAIVSGDGLSAVHSWPQIADIADRFYAKPTGGKLMISPADAEAVEPHDAWADDLKLAEAIEAMQEMLDVSVTRIEQSWGGLRSFVPDGLPVAGFDPEAPGFFWLAGQGGYGIQTSPALGGIAAALIRGAPSAEITNDVIRQLAVRRMPPIPLAAP